MQFGKLSHDLALAFAIGACASICVPVFRPALASAPVHKTYAGCVHNGVYTSENGYVIRIRQAGGKPLDLSKWDNKRLRITGNLLPGDVFFLTAPPVVVAPCR
jgi:hypothetical protein